MIANVCSIARLNIARVARIARLQTALDLLSDFGGSRAHSNPSRLHRFHFVFCFARPARDNCSGVAHPASRRRGLSGDETHHRLLDVGLNVLRGRLLRVSADLADHYDGVRIRVGIKKLDGVEERRANNRISADPDARRLADPELSQLPHRFIR